MEWLAELIDRTKELSALERFFFIKQENKAHLLNEFVDSSAQNIDLNLYIEAVILTAEYIAVETRDFKKACEYVLRLKKFSLTELQQAHVERLIGSYYGKREDEAAKHANLHHQGIAALKKSVQLFDNQNDLKWKFNVLMNLIGVYARHPSEFDESIIKDLYVEIINLKTYDDTDKHGTFVSAYWIAYYYYENGNFLEAEKFFRDMAGYEDNQYLKEMAITSSFDELGESIKNAVSIQKAQMGLKRFGLSQSKDTHIKEDPTVSFFPAVNTSG